jgi:predicted AlkP superfamily phosphohydrolase/phosphomutase
MRKSIKLGCALYLLGVVAIGALFAAGCADKPKPLAGARSVVILGIDGMDPKLLSQFAQKGVMPNFRRLMEEGSFSPLRSSIPPQSPVAWSNFTTGKDAGGHGIYDFIHCDHKNYMPMFSAAIVEGPRKTVRIGKYVIPLSGGRVENLRKGEAFWQVLDTKDIPYVVFKIPSNFPPVKGKGISVSGMGTPDILGTYGTFSFFTDDPSYTAMDVSGGQVIPVELKNDKVETALVGPKNSFLADNPDMKLPFTVSVDRANKTAKITIGGKVVLLNEHGWSPWLEVSFDALGPFEKVSGITRLYLKSLSPYFMLYAGPININPADPVLPISTPPGFAKQLYEKIGYYSTKGMPEDTKALEWGVFDDGEFIEQTNFVFNERCRMLDAILADYHGGLLFFYFSTLDLSQHMLWRDFDPKHPAHDAEAERYAGQLERYYTQMDSVLGVVRNKIPPDAVLMIMSDHGFSPFYYKFNLNTWLYENGYITLLDPSNAGEEPLFRNVFWRRTRAFGLGINGLYINVRGRDAEGVVNPGEAYDALVKEICEKLLAYRDPNTGLPVVKSVHVRDETYHGDHTDLAPDIVVGYDRGYRCSDESALGAFSKEIIKPNLSKWSGDHCMATEVVPGVFLSNRALLVTDPALLDFAATVLGLYGVEKPADMGGRRLVE